MRSKQNETQGEVLVLGVTEVGLKGAVSDTRLNGTDPVRRAIWAALSAAAASSSCSTPLFPSPTPTTQTSHPLSQRCLHCFHPNFKNHNQRKKYKKKILEQVSPYSELNNTAKNTSNQYTSNSDPCTHFRKNLQNGKNGSQNPVLKTTQNSTTFALKISKTHT
jgi:hypothetical protein